MQVGCNKSHMYIVIPRAIVKKTIQRDTLKNTIIKSRWNPKCLINTWEARKEEQRCKKKNKQRKQGERK